MEEKEKVLTREEFMLLVRRKFAIEKRKKQIQINDVKAFQAGSARRRHGK